MQCGDYAVRGKSDVLQPLVMVALKLEACGKAVCSY